MRKIINLKEGWRFTQKGMTKTVCLPHTWNAEDGQDGGNDYYRGTCTYQRQISAEELTGDINVLEINGAAMTCEVFLNGKALARHEGGFSTFRVELPEPGELLLQVDNSDNDTVYPQKADFTFYGGLYREVRLAKGDKLMVVKNCYQFLEDIPDLDFIANGDVAQLVKISRYEERYGLHFAEAVLSFPDYNDVEVTAKVILDTLDSEQPSLGAQEQRALYEGVNADYADVRGARKRYQKVREDPYYNALQIKYATAITGHKSQGGQWRCVFIDNPFWKETTLDDLKWLYTAITRGVEKIFFVNFRDDFFQPCQ